MSTIASKFESLPPDNDADPAKVADYRRRYTKAYDALAFLKLPKPQDSPMDITRDNFETHLQTVAGTLIKNEIDNDPTGRGYAGMTDQQIADAMNRPYKINVNTGDEIISVWTHSRGYLAIVGVPYCPNVFTAQDIAAAKV